jgi:ethanolamine utilization protein EutP (predicted NTPase)
MGLKHVPVVKSLHSVTTETGDVTQAFTFPNQQSDTEGYYVSNYVQPFSIDLNDSNNFKSLSMIIKDITGIVF